MTDEKSIEERLDDPDAGRHATGDDVLVRLERDERMFATCGDPETARDCRDARAEIRRMREELATVVTQREAAWKDRDRYLARLDAETARRESAEALLRKWYRCDGGTWSREVDAHFIIFTSEPCSPTSSIDDPLNRTCSDDTKEADR